MSSRTLGVGQLPDWQRWKMETIVPGHSLREKSGLATVGELEQIQDQARSEAHSEGFEEGRAQGRAEGLAEAARMKDLAAALEQSCTSLQNEIADDVLTLALDVARQILHEALPVKREFLLPVVREAIQSMPAGTQGAQIMLNPADVELVRSYFGEELRLNSWQIVEDHRIQPGGCRLASPHCAVDATLANRWKRVLAALGKDHAWLDT